MYERRSQSKQLHAAAILAGSSAKRCTGLALTTLVAAMLAACGGGGGSSAEPTVDAKASVVSLAPVAAGVNCTFGGQSVTTGFDLNGNGLLEANEATNTIYACDGAVGATGATGATGAAGSTGAMGANGLHALISTSVEAPGANCANGGVQILSGLDTDNDGLLQLSEATQTRYACSGVAGPAGAVGATGVAGATGATGLNAMAAIANEPAGANCADGGSKVTSGVDADANGVLGASEVALTSYVCNGAASRGLTAVSAEAAGVHCPTGGAKFTTGIDANSDGVLDVSEVTGTAYSCSGAAGATGQAGTNSLVAVAAEAAGANCSAGGSRITAGLDLNASGVLDAAEITSTSYVCAGATGVTGAAGLNTLSASVSEPIGLNCSNGGSRINLGADANRNNVLDASEITTSSFACNGGNGSSTIAWTIAGVDMQMVPNHGYLAFNDTARVNLTLPVAPVIGDIVEISGAGEAGYRILPNVGQNIRINGLFALSDTFSRTLFNEYVYSADASADGKVLLTSSNYGVKVSTDYGKTFTPVNFGGGEGTGVSRDGSKLFLLNQGNFYASTDGGLSQTTYSYLAGGFNRLKVGGNGALYAIGEPYNSGLIYKSIDNGQSWTSTSNGTPLTTYAGNFCYYTCGDQYFGMRNLSVSSDGSHMVFTDIQNGQVLGSSDGGATFSPMNDPLANAPFMSAFVSDDGLKTVAIDYQGRVWVSQDFGLNWVQSAANGFTNVGQVKVIASADAKSVLVSTNGQGLFTSRDSGATFTRKLTSPYDFTGNTASLMSADGKLQFASNNNSEAFVRYSGSITSTLPLDGSSSSAISLLYLGSGSFGIRTILGGVELSQ